MERTNEVPDDAGANGASQTRDAKTAMIEIAEKLIGERGLDRVSMRDVATAAGQRNNSAVQYHFGGRDGLIRQVLRRRLTALDSVRQQRLADIDEHGLGTDLASLMRVLFEPIVELLRASPDATHYARFLQRMGPVMGPEAPEVRLRTATDDVVVRLIDVCSHLPRRVAFERIDLATQMFTGALAVYEDRRDASSTVVNTDFEKVVAHLYDMIEAALRAGQGASGQGASGQGSAGQAASAPGSHVANAAEAGIAGR